LFIISIASSSSFLVEYRIDSLLPKQIVTWPRLSCKLDDLK
jgi:hypothetical protein